MNADCHGTFFQVDGKVYYRCLWDGAIIRYFDADKPGCPNCHRKIYPKSWKPLKAKTRTIKQAFVNGFWVDVPKKNYENKNT